MKTEIKSSMGRGQVKARQVKQESDKYINNFIGNKLGGEKLLSIWWVFVLLIIGGGIVIGVMIFYNAEINTNSVEAQILNSRLGDCIVNNGYLNENILNENFDIFQECKIDKKMFMKGSSFYFNVSIYNVSFYNGTLLLKEYFGGDRALEKDCSVGGSVIAVKFPKCSRSNYNELLYYSDKFNVKILVGSNQKGGAISV